MKKLTCIALMLLMGVAQADEPTVGSFNEMKNGDKILYVVAVANAYGWANAELGATKKPLLFCQPKDLVLGGHTLFGIFHSEWMKPHRRLDDAIAVVVLEGLQDTFP